MHAIERNINSNGWPDYEILDSGNRRKLERFGPYTLSRFEPDANWGISRSQREWQKADAIYTINKGQHSGSWKINRQMNREWLISFNKAKIQLRISKSRHIGIFPEQHPQWSWYEKTIEQRMGTPSVLNLFAYTGIATMFSLKAGAEVTHIDSSRSAINWAKRNLELNQLSHLPVHWIVDDVMKFLGKEIRRGKRFDAIIMDPPVFGRGPSGEVWKFSKEIKNLFSKAAQLLSENPLFMICTAYNIQIPTSEIIATINASQIGNTGFIQFGKLVQKNRYSDREIIQANYLSWSAEAWR